MIVKTFLVFSENLSFENSRFQKSNELASFNNKQTDRNRKSVSTSYRLREKKQIHLKQKRSSEEEKHEKDVEKSLGEE